MKEHVIINLDRTVNVPESMKKIGIQYDHNVKTITFDCPRYPDENQSLDMSTMKIFINWMLPDKTLGSTIATNVCVDSENENLMHFDWVITKAVTSVSGVLSTLICIKETTETGEETYHWNSELIQSFKVGNGMECTEQIAEQNIDVITQLLVQMDAVDARTSTEAMQGYVDTSVNTYLNQNPITPTDEQVTTGINTYMNNHAQPCVNNYLTEHPISPTEEQMKQGVAANSEMFQSSVDDYLGRNPLQLDNGLTETTKAAPANKVGEIQSDVTELKGDIEQKLDKPETAQVGQIFRVQSITEDGNFVLEAVDMPSGGDVTDVQIDDSIASPDKTWSSQKISDELEECVKFVKITVNLVGSGGNIPLGNTVYVYEIVNEIEILSYSVLCPNGTIIVRVPHGIQYRITASTDAEGFYAPTEVSGVAINNSEATIRYTELTHPKTIRDLQTLAKMGLADEVVAIGDEFTTTYTYDGNEFEMPWIVVEIKEVEFEDGSTGQGVFLESKYCTIESLQFDAPHQEVATEETAIEGLYYIGRIGNTYTLLTLSAGDTIPYSDYTYIYHDTIRDTKLDIYKFGHNRVSTSALRQWLNSDADKCAWWTAPKVGYCPPSQLSQYKGFMVGLPQDFVDCVAKVKRTYYTNGSVVDVLYDKFFEATGTELYASVNENEGTYWTYYKEVTGLSAPSNNQNTGRIKYALNSKTSSQTCWMFSSRRGNSCTAWDRYSAGRISFDTVNLSFRAVPACVIG